MGGLGHLVRCRDRDRPTPKGVETPQVLNDTLPQATGTAGRLRRSGIVPQHPFPARAPRRAWVFCTSSGLREGVGVPRNAIPVQAGFAPAETSRGPRGL